MRLTTKLLSALNRQTRWTEGHVFSITPEQIGIVEGIRASFAVAVMLFIDLQLHIPDFAYAAVSAFWACLCDPGGSDRNRLRVMGTYAIGATLAISLAAYAAHWGKVPGGAALFVLVLICGLTRSYRPTFGPMPAPVGLIAAIAVVVGVTSPKSAIDTLELGACFFGGAIWALVLCVYLWRTHPRAPARRALVAIFGRLEDMTASLLELDAQAGNNAEGWSDFNIGHRRAVRFSIERGREIVARIAVGRPRFAQGVDAAGRVFAALMAVGHYRAEGPHTLERPLLEGLRQLLGEAMRQAEAITPSPEPLLTQAAQLLQTAAGRDSVTARAVATAAGALRDLAQHWQEPEPDDVPGDAAPQPQSFKIPPPVWRQAMRVAVAVSISYTLGAWYEVSFSYWGTIATLVLMQPLGANTWLRILERGFGSIVGGVLTAILIARLSGPWEMLLFIAPLSAAVIALRLVNYGLFVVFVTPMFVLVSDLIHPASDLIATRAINEAIGACIGLAGTMLLWPEKEKGALSDALANALAANMSFAAGMLRVPDDLDPLRREAGLASSRAEIARQRLLLQGRSQAARLDRVQDILTALRAVCGAANVVALTRPQGVQGCDAARADRYDRLTGLLRAELTGGRECGAIAALDTEGGDDLDRAVHGLVLAVQDYSASIAT